MRSDVIIIATFPEVMRPEPSPRIWKLHFFSTQRQWNREECCGITAVPGGGLLLG